MKMWIEPLLAIATLTVSILTVGSVSVKAEDNPYGKILMDLWAEGARLGEQSDFAGAQRIYEKAVQHSQTLPDPLVKRCAILFSRVELEIMIAVQNYIHERRNDPEVANAINLKEGIEITIIQQNYASLETLIPELNLGSVNCPDPSPVK